MTSKPNAIFFDLDETLIENKMSILELFERMYLDFVQQLGSENQKRFFDALRSNAAGLWESMFDSQITPEQKFTRCFEQSILATRTLSARQSKKLANEMFEHYLDLATNNVVLNDGALDTLAQLSNRGVITGIITNGMEQVQLGKIHRLDLQNRVDHVTVSAQARAHKPHRPVFDLALTRAQVSADKAWQVGDHAANDVAAAVRIGMGGVFYNPSLLDIDEIFAELDERPTHVIKHLIQVLDIAKI